MDLGRWCIFLMCVRWVPWRQPRRGTPDRPQCPRMLAIQDPDPPSIRSTQFQKNICHQSCFFAPSGSVAACAGRATSHTGAEALEGGEGEAEAALGGDEKGITVEAEDR